MNEQEPQLIAEQIRQDVLHEFEWDARLEGSTIDVVVDDGAVILSGIAPTYGMRYAALRAARRVHEELNIINNVQVVAHCE